MIFNPKISGLLLLGFVAVSAFRGLQEAADQLTGTIFSESGKPVDRVKIFGWGDATSNAEGKFDLGSPPAQDSLVHFQKEGFQPKTVVFKPGTDAITVTLGDDLKTAWTVGTCTSSSVRRVPKGAELQFSLPKNEKMRRIKDIDFVEFLVSSAIDLKPLQLWYGPMVGPGQMIDDQMIKSTSFIERSIHDRTGKMTGFDRRGRSRDGTFWRAADFPGLSASAIYEGVTGTQAAAYDSIIDSACQLERLR